MSASKNERERLALRRAGLLEHIVPLQDKERAGQSMLYEERMALTSLREDLRKVEQRLRALEPPPP